MCIELGRSGLHPQLHSVTLADKAPTCRDASMIMARGCNRDPSMPDPCMFGDITNLLDPAVRKVIDDKVLELVLITKAHYIN